MEMTSVADSRRGAISSMADDGFTHFTETLWSTALNQSMLARVRSIIQRAGYTNVDTSLVIPGDGSGKTSWIRSYDQTGGCRSHPHFVEFPTGSVFLKLTFGYSSEQERINQSDEPIRLAGSLRMLLGVPAARELVLRAEYSEAEVANGHFTDVEFASVFDTQSLNLFDNPPIEAATLAAMPPEVALNIDRAFGAKLPYERFVFLWNALEAAVASRRGTQSNGQKRQQFFEEELGSTVANNEVYRLFKIRSHALKEGNGEANNEQNAWSLYAALQLLLLEDCPQRDAFLNGYEASILSGNYGST